MTHRQKSIETDKEQSIVIRRVVGRRGILSQQKGRKSLGGASCDVCTMSVVNILSDDLECSKSKEDFLIRCLLATLCNNRKQWHKQIEFSVKLGSCLVGKLRFAFSFFLPK